MKTFNKWLMEAFGFSKTEMNGTWLLVALIILAAIVPRVLITTSQASKRVSNERHDELIAWADEVEHAIKLKEKKKPKSKWKDYSKEKWVSNKEARNSEKKTNSNESGFTKSYQKTKYSKAKPPVYSESSRLDINKSSAEDLQNIRGIGPVLSKRIIKYRNLLGGFSDIDQFKEIYGLKPEVVDLLSKVSFVSDSVIRIDINTDSLKSLASHPYINYGLARSLINYKKVHGSYRKPEDLLNLKLMTDSIYQKLYPYISTSHDN
ncbi:MAG: helix-hairpin-helix domain-containing protein [Cyclobacteriaceae bacterium]